MAPTRENPPLRRVTAYDDGRTWARGVYAELRSQLPSASRGQDRLHGATIGAMRKAFTVLAFLLMLAVVVQFFLAASGAFDSGPNDEAFRPHRALGYGILLFAILMTIVAAVARLPGRLIGMTGLVAGLVVLQVVIRMIAKAFGDTGDTSTTAGQLVFGLHAINALAIEGVAGTIVKQARDLTRSAAGVPAAPAPQAS